MTRPGFLSVRMTPARRAAIDELAAIARLEGDAATLDFALGYTLAQLAGKEANDMGRKLAERIYNEVFGGDDKYHRAEHQGRIEDWLNDGDLSDNPTLEQLVAAWIEYDQPEERDSYE